MNKNFFASVMAATLFLAPSAFAQNGDTMSSAPGGSTAASAPAAAPTTNVDVNVQQPAAPAPAAPAETTINMPAPSAPSTTVINQAAPPVTKETTVKETNSRVVNVDHPEDSNWGVIVGAGLIGLTVVALLVSSRRGSV